ncbi:hypothetical protein PUV52_07435 [Leuconostoc mesenteroides]|uniref:Uncharacterized protein n=1 Tax=Leuconostoc mesenteroides subsp. mesenteroides (strain ATCC 8293 / DSM 20343 / BCRC 11652 / CCM 1803 / JCM 6124 / NCDO 523 / NBRC 100496 / NCIMB 8023 / NCTC 12954 / NRRL B-1118 / 37Y) TaxID=203120 RepID=Q03WR2_LEUMM|nr:hypothetical protein [Leuconostoc mesenteroides]ABJ62360.1 hypothetical protein LEUM_1263 [Leuconostoc mesenteroides subsp. mesenteroides ATCC 8293]MCT3042726.1 hypothetical protein [Leuconostoc mesenteroides]MCT3045417.1 hypothetical protein [Leuconostoc mesenteroides]MDG9747229.1 hypothetical protein [Leuconostoc mesenteroides]QQB30857.1 hypothetical protein I6H90_08420 [Leuconostoc mesenteroides]
MSAIITITDKFRNVFQRFSRFGTWFLEHQRRNLIGIFSIFVMIAFGATVLVSITPRPSNLPSTELNTPVSFGTLNKTASLTKSVFNKNNGVLELHYTISDGSVSDQDLVDISKIKFTAMTDHGGNQVTGRVVPTSNNTVVVQFKNLSHNFNAVTLTAHDKSINTATVEAPSSVVADSSNAKKTTANSNTANGKFIINRDKVSKSNTLTFATQKELEVNESNDKISAQQKLISKNTNAIVEYQKAIDQQQSSIKKYQKILAQSDDSDTQTSINNARDAITQIRTQVSDAQNNIQRAKTNISQYQKIKKQVEDGKSLLPKPTDL